MSIGHVEMAANTPRQRVRLLSLDGGGIRGVSMITILKEIMRQVNQGRPGNEQLQPWQVFDLIGGTSTGGIIAIMLGCLKMTLDECEEAYKTLAQEIFRPKRSKMNPLRVIEYYQASERFDSQAMSNLLKDIICRRTGSEDYLLRQSEEMQSSCKVFVTTVRADDQELCLLRSYTNARQTDKISTKWKLWEALRATSAANTYFDAHLNEGVRYVDGALKNNNPVYSVMAEADDLWDMPDSVMLSIGTGEKDPAPIRGNMLDLARTLTKTLISDADTEKFFRRGHRRMIEQELLYRFNVPELGRVKLHDYRSIPAVIHSTQRYLGSSLVEREVARCVNAIRHNPDTVTGPAAVTCPLKVTQLSQEEKGFLQSLHAVAGDYEGHRITIDQPAPGTCEWFLAHDKFTTWIKDESSSLLWLTANPGCGKSVLSSFLVSTLKARIPEAVVCYFSFKNGDHNRTESHQALCTLLHQLLLRVPENVKSALEAFSAKDYNLTSRNIEELWNLFNNIVKSGKTPPIYFIADALDECSEGSRNRLIDLLSSSFSYDQSKEQLTGPVKVMVTSRPWPKIEGQFKNLTTIRLRGEDESQISTDIKTMVSYKVQELSENNSLSPEAKSLVEEKLLSGADQTFLWVSLVFDKLSQLQSRTLKTVRNALESIPSQLDQLYEATISQFQDRDMSLKLLQLVVAATQPLYLDEINIIMNIDQETKSLDSLRINLEPNMEYAAKQLGGFFIRIIESRVHLVHQTAREFLLGCQREMLPNIAAAPHVGLECGEADISEASIQFLALEDMPLRESLPSPKDNLPDLNRQFLLKLPDWARHFYSYAAVNWGGTRGADVALKRSEHLLAQVHLLCDIKRKVFLGWWNFYAMKNITPWGPIFWHEDPLFAHLTSSRGHLVITKILLETESCNAVDKDSRGQDILSAAAWYRQEEQVDWLLNNLSFSKEQIGSALNSALRLPPRRPILDSLLRTGIDVNCSYEHEGQEWAPGVAAGSHPLAVQILLENGLIINDDQILRACRCGNLETVKLLLEHDTRDDQCRTSVLNQALQVVASEGFVDCYDLVIKFAAGLNIEKPSLTMGLENAIMRTDEHNLIELLSRGADASEGLNIASRLGHAPSTEILLQTWKYSETQLNEALTAFFKMHIDADLEAYVNSRMKQVLASTTGNVRLYNAFKIVPTFEQAMSYLTLYLKRNARISPEQYIKSTSLAIAMNEEFAGFLLDNINKLQHSPLRKRDFLPLACLWGKSKVVAAISSHHEANMHSEDRLGMTPILGSVASGNADTVQYLLTKGANPGQVIKCSIQESLDQSSSNISAHIDQLLRLFGGHLTESPISLAQRLGYTDIEKLLDAK